ncbi:MAG TPA: hypothetical protein VOB72_01370 [Candidatus Dormibacteraeota bacterium]|nr:hypothetical protein [Candidatus Dormibacteraeota bacterium]
MKSRVALPLVASAVQAAAALSVLGLPGWASAWDFFTSRAPTFASALSASRMTVSLIALVMLAWAVVRAVRTTARGVAERRRQTLAGAGVLCLGLLILGAGLSHHLGSPSVVLGAGSVKEASQEVAR